MKKLLSKTTWLGLLLLLVTTEGCYKQEGELIPASPNPPSADFLVQLFQPDGAPDTENPNYLQFSFRENQFQFSSFGHFNDRGEPVRPRSFYLANTEEEQEIAILIDDRGEPAFLYGINTTTGTKSEGLAEFERIAPGKFYLRYYYYDWANRIGTLLAETIIERSGDQFVGTATFETENLNLDGIVKSGGKKGNQSFGVPISRLDALQQSDQVEFREGFFEDIEEALENFSTSDMIDFSTDHLETVQKVGLATALVGLGLSETVIAAPAGSFIALIGGGIAVAAGVTEAVLKGDRIAAQLDRIKNDFVQLGNQALETADGLIESFRGYDLDLSGTWNELTQDFVSLEDMLSYIREEELLVTTEELDDLPDSDGVVHIALSWNTNYTDIDLWVTDPAGEKIYFDNPQSASQGYLDRDDTDGYGPENIYWKDGAPDGQYRVEVHYYGCDNESNCPVTTVTVTISNGLGYVNTVEATLNRVDDVLLIDVFGKTDKSIE